jgi:hypothetical protein
MQASSAILLFLLSTGIVASEAQAPPTPASPARPNPNPSEVAGIPVNYDEAKVGSYTLPDPLVLNNGKRVRSAKEWFGKRRPEIV